MNPENLFNSQPKLNVSHNPQIKYSSKHMPNISLDDDNLFFNIEGNDYSIDDIAAGLTNLFFND